MRKRYSRSYTVLSFLTMFSYREHPSDSPLFCALLQKNRGKPSILCSQPIEITQKQVYSIVVMTCRRVYRRRTEKRAAWPRSFFMGFAVFRKKDGYYALYILKLQKNGVCY